MRGKQGGRKSNFRQEKLKIYAFYEGESENNTCNNSKSAMTK